MIDESDDEEKQAMLAEENILQLEESEKARFRCAPLSSVLTVPSVLSLIRMILL